MTDPQPRAAEVAEERIRRLEKIIRETLWMACRYAHGRRSYSVGMYNDAARDALFLNVLEHRPASRESIFAIDGEGTREMSGLTQAEFADAWAGWSSPDAITNHCQPDWPYPVRNHRSPLG